MFHYFGIRVLYTLCDTWNKFININYIAVIANALSQSITLTGNYETKLTKVMSMQKFRKNTSGVDQLVLQIIHQLVCIRH